ncbi:MAG: Rpn family recombination-promoting nuclease/putative transposase [Clostridia bacterium]|nr:Rpn family recombination-promoting nuclease/putative transposase [Clostridia bacterium]
MNHGHPNKQASREKDAATKILEDFNDVFADILNAYVFDGKDVVREDSLQHTSLISQIKALQGARSQERDVAKLWTDGGIIVALIGLENQAAKDELMPLRVISYDAAVYKSQVIERDDARREKGQATPIYPVVTFVLNFGAYRWRTKQSLKECLAANYPKELEPYINDYTLNIIDVAHSTPEQLERLKSDFRVIADYFAQIQKGGSYTPSAQTLDHPYEVGMLLSAMTGDPSYEAAACQHRGEENVSMCTFAQSMINQGRMEGRVEGRREGRAEGRMEGREERDALYAKLLGILAPLGREQEIFVSFSDPDKLDELRKEFSV